MFATPVTGKKQSFAPRVAYASTQKSHFPSVFLLRNFLFTYENDPSFHSPNNIRTNICELLCGYSFVLCHAIFLAVYLNFSENHFLKLTRQHFHLYSLHAVHVWYFPNSNIHVLSCFRLYPYGLFGSLFTPSHCSNIIASSTTPPPVDRASGGKCAHSLTENEKHDRTCFRLRTAASASALMVRERESCAQDIKRASNMTIAHRSLHYRYNRAWIQTYFSIFADRFWKINWFIK